MVRVIGIILLILAGGNTAACELLSRADSLFANRARGFDRERILADSVLADSCIALYRQAAESCESDCAEEAHWKLLQAYFFRGFYCTPDFKRKKDHYNQAIDQARRSLELFPDSPALHVWTAVLWGCWAEAHGVCSSAGKGVAGKIRDHCEKALETDSTFCDAGALRVLGGVHSKAPKIPLILGWPSKKKAQDYLERAMDIAPRNLFTRRCLAETLWARKQREKACRMMAGIIGTPGIVHGEVEDFQMKSRCAAILSEWVNKHAELAAVVEDVESANSPPLAAHSTTVTGSGFPSLPHLSASRLRLSPNLRMH